MKMTVASWRASMCSVGGVGGVLAPTVRHFSNYMVFISTFITSFVPILLLLVDLFDIMIDIAPVKGNVRNF